MIFTSTVANTLKKTLNAVVRDTSDGYEPGMIMPKWMKEESMEDAYEDDLEVAGPGLATEKAEGGEISLGNIREGYMTRYWARTFAQKLIITEECIEDCKYKEAIDASKMLKRSMYLSVDYDATNTLARGWNTSYVGGDGLPLFSASHTLAHGGTFSNTLATPMSPSVTAVTVATTMIMNLVGHDGLVQNHLMPKKVVHPNAQWAVWAQILKSKMTPDSGNFSEINVANSELDIEPVRNPFWLNTTTNWIMTTNCDNGLKFKWRRRPRGGTWVDNDNEVMKHKQSARWARGWSDPRCAVGSQA